MNARTAFAQALAARRVVARYLRAADYKEYVERKKQKGEKPLDKKDWEARTEGGGKAEPKEEEEYEEYEVPAEEAPLDEQGKPITKLWRKKPKKEAPKEPEKKPEPKKEEKPEPKKDEPKKDEPKRPVRHGTPREIEEELLMEY